MDGEPSRGFFRRLSSRGSLASSGGPGSSLPMLRLPETARNNLVAVLGEFVGTFFFLFGSFVGTQIANTPMPPDGSPPSQIALIFIALAFGIALAINVWAFYRVTGGLFNPVVTIALLLCGGLPILRGVLIIITQFIAALVAAAVVAALFPGPLNVGTQLGGGANTAQGLFIEMFLTAQFIFLILMLAVEKHRSTFLAPLGIGAAFFLCELIGVYFTGGSLNPARSLGPAIVNRSFPGYHWIYWLGPVMGSLLACAFFRMLRRLRYHECNPGQDDDGLAASEVGRVDSTHKHPSVEDGPSRS